MKDFKLSLFKEILHNIPNEFGEDNYDPDRFGTILLLENKKPLFLKTLIVKTLNSFHYHNIKGIKMGYNSLIFNTEKILETMEDKFYFLEYLYNLLDNEESKSLLIKILAYRILGYTKVKLPVNTPEYWRKLKEMDSLIDGEEEIAIDFLQLKLRRYNLNKIGYEILAFLTGKGILINFNLEQYNYYNNNGTFQIGAEESDIVIDAGACWGDTSLYFAFKTGVSGKVYAFEFIPDNITIFKKNCTLNSDLEKRIELIQQPLWSVSDIPIYYVSNGPASLVDFEKIPNASGESKTITIDDFVKIKNILKVDFIKMDIEGAELDALKGVSETIKKFKPKLAICLYHNINDFGTIPKFLNDLNLGYKFYLGHYTIHTEETVLFATAK